MVAKKVSGYAKRSRLLQSPSALRVAVPVISTTSARRSRVAMSRSISPQSRISRRRAPGGPASHGRPKRHLFLRRAPSANHRRASKRLRCSPGAGVTACALARLGRCPVARPSRRAIGPSNGLDADACPSPVPVAVPLSSLPSSSVAMTR